MTKEWIRERLAEALTGAAQLLWWAALVVGGVMVGFLADRRWSWDATPGWPLWVGIGLVAAAGVMGLAGELATLAEEEPDPEMEMEEVRRG